MIEFLKQPWPWYIAGPLIGLTVPALLILGNKSFESVHHYGIFVPHAYLLIFLFKYDWKKEAWNLFLYSEYFWVE